MYEAPDPQLYYAVVENDLSKLQVLIDQGRNLDEFYFDDQNISTKSLLHVACEKGRYDFVKLLVDNNASLDVRDKWGQSPLMYAISAGHAEVAEILLEKDPELSEDRDSFQKTALHCATERGYMDGIQVMLKHGADINCQTIDGCTPITRAICERDLEDCIPTVGMLIEAGADVNIRDRRNKRTALQNAVLKRNIKAVELLLEAGADTNSLDGAGRSALTNLMCHHVKKCQDAAPIPDDLMAIIVMLVQAGTDLKQNICEYCNVLLTASYLKTEQLIRFFLISGADASLASVMGVTPLLVSVSQKDIASVKTLLEWNTHIDTPGLIYKRREDKEYVVDPFELSIMEGHFDITKLFVAAGYSKYRRPYLFGRAAFPDSLKEDPEMKEWLLQRSSRPEALLNILIFRLRTLLGRDVKESVKRLPLPARIRGKVALSELLDITDDFT